MYVKIVRKNVRKNEVFIIHYRPRNAQRCVLKQGTFQMKGFCVLRAFSIDFYVKISVKNVRKNIRKNVCTNVRKNM